MPLYDPDGIPTQAEIDQNIVQIEDLTGNPVTPQQKADIAGMTRKEIAEYIKGIVR